MTVCNVRRRLVLAVLFLLAASATSANAQTVWVTNVMPGSTVELVVNADTVARAPADTAGLVKLAAPAGSQAAAPSMHVYMDVCGSLYRVLLEAPAADVPRSDAGCQRSGGTDLFEVQPVTTFVWDASGARSLRVRQGPAFPEWIHPVLDEGGKVKTVREPLPTGLIVSAGAAGVKVSDIGTNTCGDASACTFENIRIAPAVGASLWVTRFLAVEVGYMQPQDVTMSGTGTNLTFTSVFQSRIARAVGEPGLRAGPARLYAMAGVDYAITESTTTQTVTPSANGPGGTQTFALETKGLGLLVGGGTEFWLGRRLALFAEGGRAAIKGSAVDNGQGSLNDALLFGTVGARLHIGL